MTILEKRLLDNVINNDMYKRTSVENNFLLFATLVFKHNKTSDLMVYFDCSRSKVSKLRNGLQNYSQNDLVSLNWLHQFYKQYINEYKHVLDKVL